MIGLVLELVRRLHGILGTLILESSRARGIANYTYGFHIFDYDPMPNSERRKEMKYWVDECVVRGQMAILWHPHTLSKDYNWGSSFDDLLKLLIED